MNIELTPEQVQFVERAIASGQYASVEEVLSQVLAIGIEEVEKQIVLKTELQRLREMREQDVEELGVFKLVSLSETRSLALEDLPQKLDTSKASWKFDETYTVTDEQREFLEALNESKRRGDRLWNSLGRLLQ